ncbi:5-oxopent-3-ene-1,2,5-tricarboxylate decarboxylase [Caballeronia udeis]|uniref:5-oxopent-3-ene-1,2,5-tricarboxylate decarboxylase n=1 Tax=Caballeronia udeis TaxID=1232866 RepID=A0A158GYB2_9BURK|nr:fumarylacetoacetate hydrolase family protein [Caballeronia udeis]SAL37078.1 5-oxopent-3-ene-1,2,5-tricarboxylate decarboxylase [Caballeronia udeis]
MKLVSYSCAADPGNRAGALLNHLDETGEHLDTVVDLRRAYALYLSDVSGDPFADGIAAVRIPADLTQFIIGGAQSFEAAKQALSYVENALGRRRHAPLVKSRVLLPLESVRLLAPITRPGKIVAIGANYAGHIKEGRSTGVLGELPAYPVAFLKMSSAVVGPDEAIVRSRHTQELDYEIELSMVIGKRCRDVAAENWRDVVAGFTIVNDVSMRDLIVEEKPTGVVFQGKNLDATCPLGPCIVTEDEIADPGALDIRLRVNGETRQSDNTSNMIFSCAQIIAYWSSRLTLEPGDIVTTGTTSGVAGFNRRFPERLLKHGDVVEAEIEGIGVLRNPVADEATTHAEALPQST